MNSVTRHPTLPSAVCALAAVVTLACAPVHAQTATWSAGSFSALGVPTPLPSAWVVNAVGGVGKSFDANTVIDGRINWQAPAALTLGPDNITLRINGAFDQQVDGAINPLGGSVPLLDNAGVISKSGGPGDLTVNVRLLNRSGATLNAGSGRIVYRNDSVFEAASRFAGAGAHVFSGVGRNFDFGGDFTTAAPLQFAAGNYRATAAATMQATATFLSGTFAGPWTLATQSTLTAVDAGTSKTFSGHFTNNGRVVWNTSNSAVLGADTTWRNNGIFDQRADGVMAALGGAVPTFDNAGTLRKSAGGGDLAVNVRLVNRDGASLDAASGRIVYRNDSVFEGGSRFVGSGTHVFSGVGASFDFTGDFTAANNLLLAAGTYRATAPVRVRSDLQFAAGTLSGAWTLDAGRTLRAVDAGTSKTITGRFVNDGRIEWATSNALVLGDQTTLRNNGRIDQLTDGALVALGGAVPVVENAGTLSKVGGAGEWRVSTALVNTGVIESLSGTIALPADWRNDGVLRGIAGFRTSRLTNAGTIAPGLPGGDQAIASLSLAGALLQIDTGVLSFDVASGGFSDVFDVSGSVRFAGVLDVIRHGDYAAQVGDTFRVMHFASSSGTLADIRAVGFADGIGFVADYGPGYLDLRVAAVPEPASAALLLAGLWAVAGGARRRLARV